MSNILLFEVKKTSNSRKGMSTFHHLVIPNLPMGSVLDAGEGSYITKRTTLGVDARRIRFLLAPTFIPQLTCRDMGE